VTENNFTCIQCASLVVGVRDVSHNIAVIAVMLKYLL